jgi:histidine triad (HIT) family protein
VKFLYRLARSWLGGLFLGWVFSYLSFVIPTDRLHETDSIVAFHHPDPSYTTHILLVPKRKYRSLLDIPADDTEFMTDLIRIVQDLVNELRLDDGGYRLVVNGGDAQDIQHLHFHLISDVSLDK